MLPGGLWIDGVRRRDFVLRPLTGEVELAVAEQDPSKELLPHCVTAVLAAALESLADLPATFDLAGRLCVADRQFLMRRLAAEMGLDALWLTPTCDRCGIAFDVPIVQSELPVKPAGAGFPFVDVSIGDLAFRLRVPNGHDQEAVAGISDLRDRRRRLLERCMVGVDDVSLAHLTDPELDVLDAALEAVSPELVVEACVACPGCGGENTIPIDPYLCLGPDAASLFAEVHVLAWAYHWSEASILALPVARRRFYLRMVDSANARVA